MVSYDPRADLAAFARAHRIPYALLSDEGSVVIRRFGILNTLVSEDDRFAYGIPYPGTYLLDESGVVSHKFFHRHLANREGAEAWLDALRGAPELHDRDPQAHGGVPEVQIRAFLRGGDLKVGALRRLVVRFELAEGFHLYADPAPEGLVPAKVAVAPRTGLVTEDTRWPATRRLRAGGLTLDVYEGCVDAVVPVYVNSQIGRAPWLRTRTISLEVEVRYQACDDATFLPPRSETLRLDVPLARLVLPNLPRLLRRMARNGLTRLTRGRAA